MSYTNLVNEAFPDSHAAEKFTASHIQKGFKISARKLPISKSGEIAQMSEKLGIPVPEMIFGDNFLSIEHLASGWHLNFNAFDALDRVCKTDEAMLKVSYSQEWSKSREKTHDTIKQIVKPYDWSYTTDYKGSIIKGMDFHAQEDGSLDLIPVEMLKRPDPILFYEEVVLYESELDDNGISLLNCKVRVMPDRMLLLCRLYMRVDNVIIRIRDTRIYVDFDTGKVIRDYVEKEEKFAKLKQSLAASGVPHADLMIALRDSNQIAHLLPEVKHTLESLTLV
ncbi:TIP41-like protein [Erysiphe necator]|uniref:Putative type 2a phosphatase activator tip41 n=1 Tax=Uncinula necator TaxID=52586 RepID=A0A0B1P4V2_UNCNE|nr:TIP41-like protein [Erysiphe necator]KHJ31976.1 putative type 2a phosphatase activator tip41 [Erysiphe necator]